MSHRLVVLSLSLALLLVAFAPGASAPIEKPMYARGDFWTYRTTLAEEFGLLFEGNTTVTAGTVIDVTVQGETLSALELSVQGGGTFSGDIPSVGTISGSWTITGADHWETNRWEAVRSFVRLIAEGSIDVAPQPIDVALQFVNETTRRVTEDTFAWPIREGSTGVTRAHWNVTQNVTVSFGFAPTFNVSYVDADFVTTHVHNGTASTTVAAGTFTAHRIEESGPEGRLVRWFAPRVGGDVRREEYNATDALVASSELTVFRYRAGEPAPPFPWLYAILVGLGTSAVLLAVTLALRRRRPSDLWMPPEAPSDRGLP